MGTEFQILQTDSSDGYITQRRLNRIIEKTEKSKKKIEEK